MGVAVPRRSTASHVVHEALLRGELVLRSDRRFNGVKTFCTAEAAIAWIDQHDEVEIVDISAGTLAIVIAYWQSSG